MDKINFEKILIKFLNSPFNKQFDEKLKSALKEQGLEYKDGEIVKTQRRIAAEAKEAIFDGEDEKVRKEIIDYCHERLNTTYGALPNIETIKRWLTWLEKQEEFDANIITREDEILQALSIGLSDVTEKLGWNDFGGLPIEEIQNWLKKQGEQKSIWHNEDEEPQRDSLILLIMQSGTPIVAKMIEPNHTFNHGERWAYIDDLLEKKGEKKLSWSEEDEIGFNDTLWAIQQARTIAKGENDMGNLWYAEDWLESLKYRCIWKPTKEQVDAVRLARAFVTDDFGEHPMLSKILIDLEEQLKKLRGE